MKPFVAQGFDWYTIYWRGSPCKQGKRSGFTADFRGKKRIGQRLEVVIEEYLPEEDLYLGRSYAESPEIDGGIVVHAEQPLECGKFYFVQIEDANEYELIGGIAK